MGSKGWKSDERNGLWDERKHRKALRQAEEGKFDAVKCPHYCLFCEESGIMEEDEESICICGHELQDHHRSWFRGGGALIDECEIEGANETGGMIYVDGKWVDHCQRFRLARGWPAYTAQVNDVVGGHIVTTYPYPASQHDLQIDGDPLKKGYIVAECMTERDAQAIATDLNESKYVPEIAFTLPHKWRWVQAGYLEGTLRPSPY